MNSLYSVYTDTKFCLTRNVFDMTEILNVTRNAMFKLLSDHTIKSSIAGKTTSDT